MRYWFTTDGSTALLVTACYYAIFDCGKVQQRVVDLPDRLDNADHYAEITFIGGQLAPGASAQLDQLAIRDPGGATYTQGNDHSFLNQSSFTDNPHVTVYVDGQLVWGSEPAPLPEVKSVEVQYANLDPDPLNNAIKPGSRSEHRNGRPGPCALDPALLVHRRGHESAAGVLRLRGDRVPEDHHDLRQGQPGPTRSGFVPPGRVRRRPLAGRSEHRRDAAPRAQVRLLELRRAQRLQLRHEHDLRDHDEVTAYLDGVLVWGTEP